MDCSVHRQRALHQRGSIATCAHAITCTHACKRATHLLFLASYPARHFFVCLSFSLAIALAVVSLTLAVLLYGWFLLGVSVARELHVHIAGRRRLEAATSVGPDATPSPCVEGLHRMPVVTTVTRPRGDVSPR